MLFKFKIEDNVEHHRLNLKPEMKQVFEEQEDLQRISAIYKVIFYNKLIFQSNNRGKQTYVKLPTGAYFSIFRIMTDVLLKCNLILLDMPFACLESRLFIE